MSAYLKRLNITDVDDSGETVGAYIKRVHIVEVVDSDGNPWDPAPDPDQTFGTFSLTPSDLTKSAGTTQTFTSSFTGDATSITYSWSVRSGSATIQSGQGTANATYLFTSPGAVQIQCYVTSPNASDSPASFVSMVIVT